MNVLNEWKLEMKSLAKDFLSKLLQIDVEDNKEQFEQ